MILSANGDAEEPRLAARLAEGPHVFAPAAAQQRLSDWLSELAAEQAAAIGRMTAESPRAQAILLGITESSPFLFDLIRADAARLLRILQCEPEPYFAALIEHASHQVFAATDEAEAMQVLRRTKAEAALL